jgi:ferric-dicitrate binding protein FerR (iron transport regulator)
MRASSSDTVVLAAINVRTGVGERREVVLPDSSRVTLAPRSELTYPSSFDMTGTRDVHLSGRAYFSVTKNAARPFLVQTAGAVARVLGTEFDVHEVGQSGDVEVAVAEGRVRLAASVADTLAPVLTAGHLGRFDRALGSVRVTTGIRVEDYLSWRDGRLRASGQPLGELAAELSHWYDVDVTVAPTLATRRMSVDVRVGADAPLDDVLRALTLPLDARFSKAGRNITMVPR